MKQEKSYLVHTKKQKVKRTNKNYPKEQINKPMFLFVCLFRIYIMKNIEWYNSLNKPFLSPPDWVFMPVWIILYAMIFISLLIFCINKSGKKKTKALIYFFIQFGLNLCWSEVFFGLENIRAAMIIIIFMWLFILLTISEFYKQSKISAILLLPYFLWVSFACHLNFQFLRLN